MILCQLFDFIFIYVFDIQFFVKVEVGETASDEDMSANYLCDIYRHAHFLFCIYRLHYQIFQNVKMNIITIFFSIIEPNQKRLLKDLWSLIKN